ncbi:hypothetical protein TSUD_28770 [Trifolium subterraneum]|uniref:Retrovirus-related Pol polyprotein from transposon TNT 1-94-like beta-barrel domain-containing protein n=1 Tax=Trifolium subterraneum TaxID=3900 RepID=A0A2Z6P5X7_TRISU|nr:hypothetical protein TSUD_28770 [Trifolium subterraneum]
MVVRSLDVETYPFRPKTEDEELLDPEGIVLHHSKTLEHVKHVLRYLRDCAMLSQMLEHLSFRCSTSQRLYLSDALSDVLYNVVIFIVQEADEQVNTVLDSLPANATKQQRTTFREAQQKDSKTLFLIHQCVDSNVFEKIADATTSKDAWNNLQKSYGEYFTRVETLTNQMKNCGSTLSEEEMVEKVLRTLTHKFDHIVVTIEQTKDLSEIKMEDLQSTLETHEFKHGEINHGKEDEQALFVKFKKYQDVKKKWQNKKGSKKCKAPMKKKSQNNRAEANVAEDASTLDDDVSFMVTITDEEELEEHMTEKYNGSDKGPLLMMPTTKDEFGKQEGCRTVKSEGIGDMLIKGRDGNQVLITDVMYVPDVPSNILSIEQLVEKGFTLSLGNNQMKVNNVENKMVFCASLSQSRTVQVKFENSNSEVLIEKESDKSIKILRTDGASKHTSKEPDSEHQKVHISEDVIMNEVHINEDSESDCHAETDVEAHEVEVSAVEANVETRAGSTKARESDVEADAEASEAEVSAVEANVETRARSTRTKDWNAETKKPYQQGKVKFQPGGKNVSLQMTVESVKKTKYAGEILRRFNMVESKSAMEMNLKPEKNQSKEANCRIKVKNHGEDPTIIKKVARCLRYLYKSRPDICLVKGLVSRFKENTRKSNMNNIARRIMKYIAGTLEFGILFPKSARNAKPDIEIVCFSDDDWCGDMVDRRSTSGYVFKFQNAPVSWCSKKQSVIALSSCEERSVPEAKKGDVNCQL